MSYDNFATTFSNSRKNHPWPELDYIIDDIKKNSFGSILDIGCGNGRFLEEYKGEIHHYLGLDNSRGMIEEAKKLHPEYDFQVLDMLSLINLPSLAGGNPKKYDAIIFLASFHHLEKGEERTAVLESLKRFLASNGRVYMTNWNLLDQPRYEKSHRGNGDFDIKIGKYSRYYHGFTLSELEGLFFKTGFQILENRIFEGGKNFLTILCLQ